MKRGPTIKNSSKNLKKINSLRQKLERGDSNPESSYQPSGEESKDPYPHQD